jgi:hypothetical protein
MLMVFLKFIIIIIIIAAALVFSDGNNLLLLSTDSIYVKYIRHDLKVSHRPPCMLTVDLQTMSYRIWSYCLHIKFHMSRSNGDLA